MGHTYTTAISPTYEELVTAGANATLADVRYKPNRSATERRIHRMMLDPTWKSPAITCAFTTAVPYDQWLAITPPIPMLDANLESIHADVKIGNCAGEFVLGVRIGDSLTANNVIDTSAGAFYKNIQLASSISSFPGNWYPLVPGKGYDNYGISAGGGKIAMWFPESGHKIVPAPYAEIILYYSAQETTPVDVRTEITGIYYRRQDKWQN